MNLNLRNLSKLGFKGGLMTRPTSIALLWRVRGNRVEFASGYHPGTLGVFTLTPRQLKSFERGSLSLVPEGFCSPMHSNYLGGETTLHVGPVKSCKQVEEIFQKHLDKTAKP